MIVKNKDGTSRIVRMKFHKLNLKEVSAVNYPANAHARVTFVKSADGGYAGVDDDEDDGKKNFPPKPGAATKKPTNSPANKSETDMDKDAIIEKTKAELSKALADIAARDATIVARDVEVVRLRKLSELPEAERAYHNRLANSDDRAVFLNKSAADRATEVTPVYVSKRTGIAFTKAHDPDLVTTAKQSDEDYTSSAVMLEKAATISFEKTAGEVIPGLPCDEKDGKVALVAAIEKGITNDKLKGAVYGMLKGANAAMTKVGGRMGAPLRIVKADDPEADADDKLQLMAEELAKKESISVEKAMDRVLGSPEGIALYDEGHANQVAVDVAG